MLYDEREGGGGEGGGRGLSQTYLGRGEGGVSSKIIFGVLRSLEVMPRAQNWYRCTFLTACSPTTSCDCSALADSTAWFLS